MNVDDVFSLMVPARGYAQANYSPRMGRPHMAEGHGCRTIPPGQPAADAPAIATGSGPRIPEPIIIGIDNGVSGGMVALDRAGRVLRMAVMPVMTEVSEIDSRRVIEWIRSVVGMERAVCGIEVCPDHAKQKSTMRSMAISHGILMGSIYAACRAVRIVRVVSGTKPKASWQRRLFGYVAEPGQTKTLAAAMARRIWPDQNWIPHGCRVANTGLIDAALIAHFVRTENL